MDVLMIYPKTKAQADLYQQLAKNLKNRVVKKKSTDAESSYDPEFVAKILQGDKDFEAGLCTVIKTEDLWK